MTLTFRLGPIPVRVHLWLFVAALLLGLSVQGGALHMALWASGFLMTILAHEFAHAITARAFDAPAEVNLTLFRPGIGSWLGSLSPLRRVVVCLAGPAVSLLMAALAFAIARFHPPSNEVAAGALRYVGTINLGWGLVNLLPMLPLDGGHALVALLDSATKGRAEQTVRWLSVGCAAALGLVAVHYRMAFPAFICGFVAFQNVRTLRTGEATNREALMRVHLQAAFKALERGEAITAAGHCRTVLGVSSDPAARKDAVRLLAYAYASVEMWGKLMEVLESGGVAALEDGELEKYERAARELGRSEEAQRLASLRTRVVCGG
jgi:Zn-dependent protease